MQMFWPAHHKYRLGSFFFSAPALNERNGRVSEVLRVTAEKTASKQREEQSHTWFSTLNKQQNLWVTVVQSLSCVQLYVSLWIIACQSSLSFTISQSLLKLMSIESVMPSNNLILCHRLLLLPSIFPTIRVFSSESAVHIRWPKYWSFSVNISPSNEYSSLVSFRID